MVDLQRHQLWQRHQSWQPYRHTSPGGLAKVPVITEEALVASQRKWYHKTLANLVECNGRYGTCVRVRVYSNEEDTVKEWGRRRHGCERKEEVRIQEGEGEGRE